MSATYPRTLQTALLFDETAPLPSIDFDWQEVIDCVNEALFDYNKKASGLKLPEFENQRTAGDKGMVIGNGLFQIHAICHEAPVASANFTQLRASPIYADMQPHLLRMLGSHTCHISIKVTHCAGPISGDSAGSDAAGASDDMGQTEGQLTFEARLFVAKTFAWVLADLAAPLLVHWGQSDQLYQNDHSLRVAEPDIPLILYVHPVLFSSGTVHDGEIVTGLRGLGSQHVLGGKGVVLADNPYPWNESYEIMLAFITYCRQLGRVLNDSETFGRRTDEKIRVVHHSGDTNVPSGFVQLVVGNATATPKFTPKAAQSTAKYSRARAVLWLPLIAGVGIMAGASLGGGAAQILEALSSTIQLAGR